MNSNSKVQQAKAAGHTPIPWKRREIHGRFNNSDVSTDSGYLFTSSSPEDAAFIVRACNSHDALVGVIRGLLSCTELNMDDMEEHTRQEIRHAQAALKLAKGE